MYSGRETGSNFKKEAGGVKRKTPVTNVSVGKRSRCGQNFLSKEKVARTRTKFFGPLGLDSCHVGLDRKLVCQTARYDVQRRP